MQEKITVHKDPENSVFGLVGKDILTDEEKLYIKVENDSKNIGWMEIPPTPTPTPTISLTPSLTPIVSKTPATSPTNTPTISITPSQTPTPTETRPNVTPSPTSTPNKTTTLYFIAPEPSDGGSAVRTDGPANKGSITVGTGTMQLQASPNVGLKFVGWQVSPPDSALFTDASALNPVAYNFSTIADVYITAVFATDRPACNVCFSPSGTGRVNIKYVDPDGRITTYAASGLVVGTSYCNYFRAIEILQVLEGTWWWGQCDDGSQGLNPNGFRIDGTADENGEIMFEYYDAQNALRTFSGSGYTEYQSLEGLACGFGIGAVSKGNPNITQLAC